MNENLSDDEHYAPLSIFWRWIYVVASFILVAFGQPAWIPAFGLIAAICGYALFWRVLLCFSIPSQRFWYAFIWFFCIQLVQISWFISHPYLYIFAVYLFIASLLGAQFGIVGIFINSKMISSIWRIIALACLWTTFEWSRLFLLSGFSFNPIGAALGGSIYSLQMASLFGIFGLSFWVVLTNLLALRAWTPSNKLFKTLAWLAVALIPYFFGVGHLYLHTQQMNLQPESTVPFKAVLVQTAFPVEESIDFTNKQTMISYVKNEWKTILSITKKHLGKPIDLIALPEFVVPFGTYATIYPYQDVVTIFSESLGPETIEHLPSPGWPLGSLIVDNGNEEIMVNNAFWVQSIANVFNAHVIAGLEDADDLPNLEREYYSAAIYFQPQLNQANNALKSQLPSYNCERYEKRVLVPMGEYIPFSFCRELAQQYGVFGSFTAGKEAKVIQCGHTKLSPSICYEETFGDIIREGKVKGANMLVNLTSDVWYPNSRLPLQHLEHARFRTVENGVPLIRACNTGITTSIDSLGKTIAVLGGENPEKFEWAADSLYTEVPTYNYTTLYSLYGDKLIIGFSLLVVLLSAFFRNFSF